MKDYLNDDWNKRVKRGSSKTTMFHILPHSISYTKAFKVKIS